MVTTVMEHNSVLRPLYEMEEKGVELTFVKADERGVMDLAVNTICLGLVPLKKRHSSSLVS